MPDIFVAGSPKTNDKTAHHLHHSTDNTNVEKDIPQPLIHFPNIANKSVHLFSAYCENPADITFKNKHQDEKVLLFVRKHLITNFLWVIFSIFLLLAPVILGPLGFFFNFSIPFLAAKQILFFTLFYYLFVANYIFIRFITWYFNVSLITNERVIDIDFSDVIYKNLAATTLDLVQDVNYTQSGVFRTFFHYGNVDVQTAGEAPHFDFDAVPQPDKVAHIIGGLIGKKWK